MINQPDFIGSPERPYEMLSFLGADGALWCPERTGSYAEDCKLGRFYAGELLGFIKVTGAHPFLGHVCAAIPRDSWGGVEVGFLQAIAEAAVPSIAMDASPAEMTDV